MVSSAAMSEAHRRPQRAPAAGSSETRERQLWRTAMVLLMHPEFPEQA
ncbi:hypothetical protein EV147_2430 [Cupriavidus agavae]|uniref:Uncharacterized protein n=1 Tax=Cupriavidus agavae TaxID=1001822 RepID=A0A4Q7RZE9_9BURK|nr:hypothetical protein EV147_2430 [Cupriavidus agavae]